MDKVKDLFGLFCFQRFEFQQITEYKAFVNIKPIFVEYIKKKEMGL
jgi:hypothetical protein